MINKILVLVISLVCLNGCASRIIIDNKMIIEGDEKIKREMAAGAIFIVIGKTYKDFQTYHPANKNIYSIQIDRNKCWNIGLASPFIPIPIIPIFKFPNHLKMHIYVRSWLKSEEEKKYLEGLEAILIVDNVNYAGEFKNKIHHNNGSTSPAYFEFSIKCMEIEKGKIIIKDKFSEDSFSFFRDSSFYYMW